MAWCLNERCATGKQLQTIEKKKHTKETDLGKELASQKEFDLWKKDSKKKK